MHTKCCQISADMDRAQIVWSQMAQMASTLQFHMISSVILEFLSLLWIISNWFSAFHSTMYIGLVHINRLEIYQCIFLCTIYVGFRSMCLSLLYHWPRYWVSCASFISSHLNWKHRPKSLIIYIWKHSVTSIEVVEVAITKIGWSNLP